MLPLFYLASLLIMQHSRPTLDFKSFIPLLPILYLLSLLPHHRFLLLAILLHLLLLLSPNYLKVLEWNAGCLRARSTELLHFFSSHSVDFFYIQESNLYSSFSFQISGFSALRSDHTLSRSGILSRDVMHADSI